MSLLLIHIILGVSLTFTQQCQASHSDGTFQIDYLEANITDVEKTLKDFIKIDRMQQSDIGSISQAVYRMTDPCIPFWEYGCGVYGRRTKCIPYYMVCDQAADCPGGEDEGPELCAQPLEEVNYFYMNAVGYEKVSSNFVVTMWMRNDHYFPSMPKITARSVMKFGDNGNVWYTECILHYALQRLYCWNTDIQAADGNIGTDYAVHDFKVVDDQLFLLSRVYPITVPFESVDTTEPLAHVVSVRSSEE